MCVTMDHKKKSNLPVLLNHSELQKLRTDAGSCVEVKTCAHHITLHPFHLSNIANSIKEILNERVAKYSAEFGGILLGFENIKIFGSKAPMYDDMCFMHQKIEADFYIFKPTIGCRLNGIIIKKSQDHIGCLVHKLFNISLPKPEGDDNWLGFKAQIGQEVQFQVSFMNLDARLPYIKGVLLTIISEDSGISTSDETAHPKKKKTKKSTKDKVDGTQSEAESVKKKKLKKKKTLPEEDILDIIFDAPEKKKKSKKDKKSKSEVPEDQNNIDQIEDLKAQPKQKKSKKKKTKPENDEGLVEQDEIETKPKKKEKKSKKEKKIKEKTEVKERDLLDESLPDLNLDALFEDGSISMQKDTDNDTKFSQSIILPADPDMDEILKDIPKKKAKKDKKSPSKKRKLEEVDDEQVTDSSIRKKKKKHST